MNTQANTINNNSIPHMLYWGLKQVLHFFLKYRLHISLIFMFEILIDFKRVNAINSIPYHVIIAFAIWHFVFHIYNRAIDGEEDRITQPNEAVDDNEKPILVYLSYALILLSVFIVWIGGYAVLPFLLLIPFAFMYDSVKVFGYTIRIKKLFLLKNLYMGIFLWGGVMAYTLYFYSPIQAPPENYIKYAYMFYFTVIAEVLWDIPDINGDRAAGVNTLPVVLGLSKTRILLCSLLVVYGIVHYLLFNATINVVLVGSYLAYILLLNDKSPKWVMHIPLPIILCYDIYRFLS